MLKTINEKTVVSGKKKICEDLDNPTKNPLKILLMKYLAQFFATKIEEDKSSREYAYYIKDNLSGTASEKEKISKVADYLFDLGGLSDRLDLYIMENLGDIGLDPDEDEIAKYVVDILRKKGI